MKVLVTGGTGLPRTLRSCRRSSREATLWWCSPGPRRAAGSLARSSTETSATGARSTTRRRRLRARFRTRPRSSASGDAAARLRRRSTWAGCAMCWRPRQRSASAESYTSSFLALPPRDRRGARGDRITTNDYQRTKVAADARWPDEAVRGPDARSSASIPAWSTGRDVHRGQSDRPADRRSSEAPSSGSSDRRTRGHHAYIRLTSPPGHCAALERGAIKRVYALGGENALTSCACSISSARSPAAGVRWRIPFGVAIALGAAEELRVTASWRHAARRRAASSTSSRHDWSLDSSPAIREIGCSITPLEEGIRRTVGVNHVDANVNCSGEDDPPSSAIRFQRDVAFGTRAAVGAHRLRTVRCCCACSRGNEAVALRRHRVRSFNLFLLPPRIGGRRLYRPVDEARGFRSAS